MSIQRTYHFVVSKVFGSYLQLFIHFWYMTPEIWIERKKIIELTKIIPTEASVIISHSETNTSACSPSSFISFIWFNLSSLGPGFCRFPLPMKIRDVFLHGPICKASILKSTYGTCILIPFFSKSPPRWHVYWIRNCHSNSDWRWWRRRRQR